MRAGTASDVAGSQPARWMGAAGFEPDASRDGERPLACEAQAGDLAYASRMPVVEPNRGEDDPTYPRVDAGRSVSIQHDSGKRCHFASGGSHCSPLAPGMPVGVPERVRGRGRQGRHRVREPVGCLAMPAKASCSGAFGGARGAPASPRCSCGRSRRRVNSARDCPARRLPTSVDGNAHRGPRA
jgi:hypothetical protein